MKIHAIQTGTVAVTTAWREGVGHGRRRLLHTILDREWTEPLPIYAFAIEHPEGVIVVDTGETSRASERIRAYAAANPTVYLVAHDPATDTRLVERRLVQTQSALAERAAV